MMITVDKQVIRNTAKCEKEFSCLIDNKPYCKVDFELTDEILILKCEEKSYCSYKRQFDEKKFVCTCPTRNEIYKNYNL